jgi:hypothetical protein
MWIALIVIGIVLFLATKKRKKPPTHPMAHPMVTSMSSDDFVDFALDVMNEHESRTGKKIVDPWP